MLKKLLPYAIGAVAAAAKNSNSSTGSTSSKKTSSTGTSKSTSSAGAYDANRNYQAEINQAVSNNNYKLAAELEQQRNQKVNAMGGGTYSPTNLYSGWLDDTDYSTIGKQQMASGASAEDVLDTYQKRANKASGTVGMEKYVNDAFQNEMLAYILANTNNDVPEFDYEQYVQSMPTYESQYDSRIDDLLDGILNRDKFSYTAADDPLYQQYQQMYNREGDRAMRNTLAEAAASAGGMNSYAVTAAQQANNYYASQLGDKVPELYQLAYEMYLQDIDSQVRDLGLLQDMDSTQYNRYRDTMSDWKNDRDFAYNMYRDQMGDYQWNKNFNYNSGRDQIADDRYQQEWDYNVGRDQIADQRYNTEWDYSTTQDRKNQAYNKAMELMSQGVMPDTATLEAAGITAAEASAYIASIKAAAAAKSSGSRSGSSGGGNGGSSGGNGDTVVKPTGSSSNGYVPVSDLNRDTNGSGISSLNDLSAGAKAKVNSLNMMRGQTGSEQAIANTIAIYADQGEITEAEARYMFQYFGYDPDEWIE